MIKTPTIMKQNPLIMAEFEQAFSEVDHDVVNILLHSLQNELMLDDANIDLFNYKEIHNREVLISASTFKRMGKFGKNYNSGIAESLKKISDTSAWIKNFTDIDGKFVKRKNIRIIDNVTWYDSGTQKDGREQAFKVQFNEWFLQVSTKGFNISVGNFTNLELLNVKDLKGKYAKKLYEILEAKKYRNTSFSMKLEDLQKTFNVDNKKTIGYFNREIKRAKLKVEKFILFDFEVFSEDKLISFTYLDKKNTHSE